MKLGPGISTDFRIGGHRSSEPRTKRLHFLSNNRLISVSQGRTVRFWNVKTGMEQRKFDCLTDKPPAFMDMVAISLDGALVAFAEPGSTSVWIWDRVAAEALGTVDQRTANAEHVDQIINSQKTDTLNTHATYLSSDQPVHLPTCKLVSQAKIVARRSGTALYDSALSPCPLVLFLPPSPSPHSLPPLLTPHPPLPPLTHPLLPPSPKNPPTRKPPKPRIINYVSDRPMGGGEKLESKVDS